MRDKQSNQQSRMIRSACFLCLKSQEGAHVNDGVFVANSAVDGLLLRGQPTLFSIIPDIAL